MKSLKIFLSVSAIFVVSLALLQTVFAYISWQETAFKPLGKRLEGEVSDYLNYSPQYSTIAHYVIKREYEENIIKHHLYNLTGLLVSLKQLTAISIIIFFIKRATLFARG